MQLQYIWGMYLCIILGLFRKKYLAVDSNHHQSSMLVAVKPAEQQFVKADKMQVSDFDGNTPAKSLII